LAFVALAFTLTTSAFASYQYQESTLYSFTSKTDGETPGSALVMDASGNLYGTTLWGGSGTCGGKGCGSVFELSPNGNGGWTKTEVYAFNGTDGDNPTANLLIDASGNLYGTTLGGGPNNGNGTVFELSPVAGGGWSETILYSFSDFTTGGYPAGITFDGKGNIFGTAEGGGANSFGAVFELSPNSSGGWTETVLYSFTNGNDGANPTGGVVFDAAGNLYAAAVRGGSTTCSNGCGTIFRLKPLGTTWLFSRLYAFQGPGGYYPSGSLIIDSVGNLYGSTNLGGHGYGVVFKLAPTSSGGWKETLLHDFTNGADGASPGPLLSDGAGNLFGGAAPYDSITNIFRLTPSGTGWIFAIVYAFPSQDGSVGPSAMDALGNFYGIGGYGSHGYGLVYKLSPPAK
jgi:uncharacterized repeat protein (TIGR03803 family)